MKPFWVSEIPESEFDQRLKKIRISMKENKFDAILVYSYPRKFPASRSGFIRYVSNWAGENVYAPSLAILQAERDPTLILSSPNYISLVKEISWIQDIRVKSHTEFPEEVRRILPADRGKLGLIGVEDIPHRSYEALQKTFPEAKIEDATYVLEESRMVKSPREIDAIRKSTSLADLAFEAFVDTAKEGVWEYQALANMECAVRSKGAEECWMSIGAGPNVGLHPASPTERKLRKGDQIVVTMIPNYRSYWSQIVRTGAIGKTFKEQENMFNLVLEAQDAAIKAMKPGVLFSDVYKAGADIIENSKYEKYRHLHARFGHGIGLDYTERPVILFHSNQDLTTEVKTGMTIAMHMNMHVPELRIGASIGDMILVTKEGAELLSKFERGLFTA